jgi:hypothetical protein
MIFLEDTNWDYLIYISEKEIQNEHGEKNLFGVCYDKKQNRVYLDSPFSG